MAEKKVTKKKEEKVNFDFEKGILGRVVTEKSFSQADSDAKYSFYVEKGTNKIEAKKLIEKKFSVKVKKINLITVPGKLKKMRTVKGVNVKRHQDKKKVIFTLVGKDKIKNFTEI